MGVGAYGSAILTTRLGFNPWVAMLVAAVLAAAIAGLVGIPTLKLKGYYLAMATLGINEIIYILLVQTQASYQRHGRNHRHPLAQSRRPRPQRSPGLSPRGVGGGVAHVPLRPQPVPSRVGRSLRSLRLSEPAAESLGVDCSHRKVQIFIIAAVFASIAGSFDASYVHYISPESYNITFSIILITGVIIGGLRSLWGAVWGTMVIVILPELLNRVNEDLTNLVFGVLLIAIMILSGGGTVSVWSRLRGWRAGRAAGDAYRAGSEE